MATMRNISGSFGRMAQILDARATCELRYSYRENLKESCRLLLPHTETWTHGGVAAV